MNEPIAGAAEDDHGRNGPQQQDRHVPLLWFYQIDNAANCQLFPSSDSG
jgi:hypothetical protein